MSEHWYGRDGSSQYDADLRKARKAGYVPSVTTVLSVIDKPALTNWLIEQAVMGALTLPKVDGESDAAWLARIKVDGRAGAKAAAEEGTRIHDAIEKSFTDEHFDFNYTAHVCETRNELLRLFPDVRDWVSEQSFAHPLGYGGKVDLHSPSTGIVVDFKTKDGDFSDGKKLAYDQNIQLAAYQMGLLLRCTPNQICANIFVSRTHPGKVASHVWSADEVARGWRLFDKALALWKELKQYDGSF